jgi:hypothetical protein
MIEPLTATVTCGQRGPGGSELEAVEQQAIGDGVDAEGLVDAGDIALHIADLDTQVAVAGGADRRRQRDDVAAIAERTREVCEFAVGGAAIDREVGTYRQRAEGEPGMIVGGGEAQCLDRRRC